MKLKSNKVIFYSGMPRAGTTLLLQILDRVFEKYESASHEFLITDKPLITNYRDFRDVGVSHWRINHGRYNNEGHITNKADNNLDYIIEVAKEKIKILNKFKDYYGESSNVLWLKYEEFYKDIEGLLSKIEKFVDITIDRDYKKVILEETSFETNRKISDKVVDACKNSKLIHTHRQLEIDGILFTNIHWPFGNWDIKSRIHARHIYTGKEGTWKELLNKTNQDVLTNALAPDLIKWGYTL